MNSSNEVQILLILDLSSENPISERSIEPLLPAAAERRAYRVSQFGARPAPQGSPQQPDLRVWQGWTEAIDRMLSRVREELGGDAERAHYYVAGRAGLPVFSYLGHRLSRLAKITVINKRSTDQWDVMPLYGTEASLAQEPFFNVVRGLAPDDPVDSSGKIAVFVSTQNELEREKIRRFARSQKIDLAGIVEIRARPEQAMHPDPRRWLSSANAAQAAAELEQLFTALKNKYVAHEGLVAFVAGPAPLAVMVGRAINPRIYTPAWFPHHRDNAYEPAVESPWPVIRGKLRILLATANTRESERYLDIEEELRGIFQELAPGGEHLEIRHCPAVRIDDLMGEMLRFEPHILHFSGHGAEGGTFFVDQDGEEAFVPADGFRQVLETTNERLRLVLMSSCRSNPQAKALSQFVDCAIGTCADEDLADEAAIVFARAFYRALAWECSVKRAFKQGKARVDAEPHLDARFFHLHPRDGVEPERLILFSARA